MYETIDMGLSPTTIEKLRSGQTVKVPREELVGTVGVWLTGSQAQRVRKASAANKGVSLKFSSRQINHLPMVSSGNIPMASSNVFVDKYGLANSSDVLPGQSGEGAFGSPQEIFNAYIDNLKRAGNGIVDFGKMFAGDGVRQRQAQQGEGFLTAAAVGVPLLMKLLGKGAKKAKAPTRPKKQVGQGNVLTDWILPIGKLGKVGYDMFKGVGAKPKRKKKVSMNGDGILSDVLGSIGLGARPKYSAGLHL